MISFKKFGNINQKRKHKVKK